MLVYFSLSDLLHLLALLPSWSETALVFLSRPWVMQLPMVLFAFPMFLSPLIWFIIFFVFVNSQLTILVLSNLTLLDLL